MKPLVSVKIIHDVTNRLVYNLYAELFRLLGVYVGEGILDEYTNEELEKDLLCFQFFLCVVDNGENNILCWDLKNKINNLIVIDTGAYDFINGMIIADNVKLCTSINKLMNSVISEMVKQSPEKQVSIPEKFMRDVINLYLSTDLMKASMLLQYYRLKSDLHNVSEKIFCKMFQELTVLNANGEYVNNRYYLYSNLYCRQYANLACYFQNKKECFSVSELSNECRGLIKAYPDFSNARVLLGLIYRNNEQYTKQAAEAFVGAIQQDSMKCYMSHVYYWLGQLYEKYEHCQEDAFLSYTSAYRLKKKYRNIYKIAQMYRNKGNVSEEIRYYEECLNVLENKRIKCMDPLELEYYFKVGVLACFSCLTQTGDSHKAITLGERILSFYNNDFGKWFGYFFGNDQATYEKLSRSRIHMKKVYECLSIAYRKIGNESKSDVYWKLVDQL